MKFPALFAAASLAIGALGATAASADHGYRHDNGLHRGYGHRDGGYDGRGYGGRDHHRHCRTEYRHHRRVTRCY